MTAATVDRTLDSVPLIQRTWLLDITEAYTWVCPMGNPIFAHITAIEDVDAYVNYTLSGRTFTFHESDGGGLKVAVTVYGRL